MLAALVAPYFQDQPIKQKKKDDNPVSSREIADNPLVKEDDMADPYVVTGLRFDRLRGLFQKATEGRKNDEKLLIAEIPDSIRGKQFTEIGEKMSDSWANILAAYLHRKRASEKGQPFGKEDL
jgi:hypothetical protein